MTPETTTPDPLRASEFQGDICLWAGWELIATVHGAEEVDYNRRQETCEERAEFIVRACNSHTALVAACKAAQAFLGERVSAWDVEPILDDIRKALESATKGDTP